MCVCTVNMHVCMYAQYWGGDELVKSDSVGILAGKKHTRQARIWRNVPFISQKRKETLKSVFFLDKTCIFPAHAHMFLFV